MNKCICLISKDIVVTKSNPGYAHHEFEGDCGPDVTEEDIKARFYHPHFGGRDAWVKNGKWGAVRYTD